MYHTRETYDRAVAAIAHTGEKKPSFKEREKLLAEYKANSITKVEKVTAVMVKEVVTVENTENPSLSRQ